jgi:hypothetical protein
MSEHNNDIEQIIKKGFVYLPVDSAAAEKAVDAVMRRSKIECENAETVPFPTAKKGWIYALAATLVLSVGAGYLLLQTIFVPKETVVADESRRTGQLQHSVSIVSAVTDTGIASGQLRYSDDEFRTDERSQLLLCLGMRTRTILFERSRVKVERADSLRTIVAMHHGSVAVDVVPGGGTDTISIVTPHASFTQIGTRFSVFADSVKGAGIEVYRGKVRVQSSSGTDIVVGAGYSWMSGKGGNVTACNRNMSELEGMRRTFTDNKMEHLLKWKSGLPQSPEKAVQRSAPVKRQSKRQEETVDTAAVFDDIVPVIEKMAARNDYRSLDSVITQLRDPSSAEAVFRKLYSAAEHKISLFRFPDAKRLFELLADGAVFPKRRREDASMRCFMLHKEHIETSPKELLDMTKRHRKRFPDGAFGDDMAAEAISLLLITRDYGVAVDEMEYLLERYPRSPHGEYYSYVYASTLRENFQQNRKALKAYKKYAAGYPNGKYDEDALYWTVQLSSDARDWKSVREYTERYIRRYPQGRWISEIRAAAKSARK